jgi:hypothetical protein
VIRSSKARSGAHRRAAMLRQYAPANLCAEPRGRRKGSGLGVDFFGGLEGSTIRFERAVRWRYMCAKAKDAIAAGRSYPRPAAVPGNNTIRLTDVCVRGTCYNGSVVYEDFGGWPLVGQSGGRCQGRRGRLSRPGAEGETPGARWRMAPGVLHPHWRAPSANGHACSGLCKAARWQRRSGGSAGGGSPTPTTAPSPHARSAPAALHVSSDSSDSDEYQPGYTARLLNPSRVCEAFVSPECTAAKPAEQCQVEGIDAWLAAQATAAGGGQRTAAVVGGVAAGEGACGAYGAGGRWGNKGSLEAPTPGISTAGSCSCRLGTGSERTPLLRSVPDRTSCAPPLCRCATGVAALCAAAGLAAWRCARARRRGRPQDLEQALSG